MKATARELATIIPKAHYTASGTVTASFNVSLAVNDYLIVVAHIGAATTVAIDGLTNSRWQFLGSAGGAGGQRPFLFVYRAIEAESGIVTLTRAVSGPIYVLAQVYANVEQMVSLFIGANQGTANPAVIPPTTYVNVAVPGSVMVAIFTVSMGSTNALQINANRAVYITTTISLAFHDQVFQVPGNYQLSIPWSATSTPSYWRLAMALEPAEAVEPPEPPEPPPPLDSRLRRLATGLLLLKIPMEVPRGD